MHPILIQKRTTLALPIFQSTVQAGFPSPADSYIEAKIDLNDHLIQHPTSTFFVKVEGQSMVGAGIYPGDVLIVDKSLEAKNKQVVLAILNGEFTVKTLVLTKNSRFLQAANKDFPDIDLDKYEDFEIWGVVVYVIHKT